MARTRIKICGVTDESGALAAAEVGADAVGFVFHGASPRNISPERAWEIAGLLPPFVSSVGLFVNASVEAFTRTEEVCPTDLSQLHGDEREEVVRACGPNIIKAVRFDPATIGRELARWSDVEEVSAILVDGSRGGEGTSFDWAALANAIETADEFEKKIIVAGGLTPGNVGAAIRAVRPWAVDVSSGVEKRPGVKDPSLIAAFCAAVRAADS
jgi:phosphoribosylanthranilate isomerase